MSEIVLANPGTTQWGTFYTEYPDYWNPGWVLMTGEPPAPVYHQHGSYIAQPNGTWLWVQTFPVLEYPVTRNSQTNEVHWSPWDDVITPLTAADVGAAAQSAVDAVQAAVTSIGTQVTTIGQTVSAASTASQAAVAAANTAISTANGLTSQITAAISQAGTAASTATAAQQAATAASTAASTAQSTASSALGTADSAMTAIASMPTPTKWEIVTVTLGTGGSANATFTNTYSVSRIAVPIVTFTGNVQFTPILGTPTATGVSVTAKKSVGTLVLNAAPYVDAVAGDVVKFMVIGR